METDSKKLYMDVSAVVTAFSHIFRLNHPTLLIRVVKSKPVTIIVRNSHIYEWLRPLEIGGTYCFTRLIPSYLWKGTSDEVRVLEASLHSEIHRVKLALQESIKDSYFVPTSYRGKVTDDSLSLFGLHELEGGSVLCSAYMSQVANLPSLKATEQIIVYNAHRKVVGGVTYLVMCGGSYLFSQNAMESRDIKVMHPIVDFVLSGNCCFEDFLWTKNVVLKLEKLLGALSPLYPSILRKYIPEVLDSLYPDIFQKMSSGSSRVLSKEFLLFPHQCGPVKQGKLGDFKILSPEDVYYMSISDKSASLWRYKLFPRIGGENKGVENAVLVGKLEVDLKTGHLVLSGGSCSIQCVIPDQTAFKVGVGLLVNQVVVVKGAIQALERFMIFSSDKIGRLNEQRFNYILLCPGSVHPIIRKKEIDREKRRKMGDVDVVVEAAVDEGSREEEDVARQLVQRFILHHVSAPLIHQSMPMFFCLVTLLGGPLDPEGMDVGGNEENSPSMHPKLCLLSMRGSMLRYFPLLCENRVYDVKYPKFHGEHYFDKSFHLPGLGMAKKILPSVKNGVIVPDKSSLQGPFELPLLPLDTLINKEIFGVKDSLANVAVKDVVHVQGVLLTRRLQTPRFQEYIQNFGLEYGVPGDKNIILQLQDVIGDETVNVYIITWMAKQYPLGLLPGATICIKFVEKKCSSRNNQFYQSTCLTSIKVLEYPTECVPRLIGDNIRRSYLRKECRVQSLKSPFWAILSISKIWSVELIPTCNWCGSQIACRQTDCSGCACPVIEPKIDAKANFSVMDGSWFAYLRVKNDHVRILLGLSEDEWKSLGHLATEKEMSYFWQRHASLQRSTVGTVIQDEDRLAFKLFCENVTTTKLWHVVCRKFFNQEDEKKLNLFCLDVEEMDFDLAESLVD